MNFTRKEMLAAATAAVLGIGLALALLLDSWRWSLAFLAALVLLVGAVVMFALRRQDTMRTGDLDRIERKVDNLALRVVTESQATHRELSGLIEELGSTLRRSDAPGA